MENKDTFIIVLIIIFAILYFYVYKTEGFLSDPKTMSCDDYPLNSNCSCPTALPQQIVDGSFPMNYGQTAPYSYRCVSSSEPEPNTTLWSTPSN
jgi:hypothetical protein